MGRKLVGAATGLSKGDLGLLRIVDAGDEATPAIADMTGADRWQRKRFDFHRHRNVDADYFFDAG